MLSIISIFIVFCLYMGFLFWLALKTEKGSPLLQKWSEHPFIYASALGIYCTTWTYYGSVGNAAMSGLGFLSFYFGGTLSVFLWPMILRKMVRIKHAYRITSIADFISARYNKSQALAALVTVIALIGVIPYVALQLRATFTTFNILAMHSYKGNVAALEQYMAWLIILLMIVFTIIFGARRLDPTETHKGMILSVALQSLVQLAALLCVGVFVTFFVFHGVNDIFMKLSQSNFADMVYVGSKNQGNYLVWSTYFVLSMSAILFLPRQFHVAVVENSKEENIGMVLWVFPLYMFLINIFVVPIAMAGLLSGIPIEQADSFVLRLPLFYNKFWLAVIVFFGGISAATSMIMISSMTVATMVTNHIFLPVLNLSKRLDFLKKHLLRFRWIFIAGFILVSYLFERILKQSYMLVNIGLISFAAVLQFAPIIIGALYWRRANRRGALMGLIGGFSVWFYTLLLPAMIKSGWGPQGILENGPWGISLLKPESLFGISIENAMVHAVFWTLSINISLFVFGSLTRENSEKEQRSADIFVDVFSARSNFAFAESSKDKETVELEGKLKLISHALEKYFSKEAIEGMKKHSLEKLRISGDLISVIKLAELQNELEKTLTGSLGSGAAHDVINSIHLFTAEESKELSQSYAEILANFKLTPEELLSKIDYYKEREILLAMHAAELEEKIMELDKQIFVRKAAEKAVIDSEHKYRSLVENLPQRIFRKDKNGIYTYCNDIYAEDMKTTREGVVGKTDYDLYPLEIADKYHDDDLVVIDKGETLDIEEKYIIGEHEIWVHTVKSPIRNEVNEITGVLGIFWDITERKRAAQLLNEAKEELESRVKERTAELIDSNKALHSKISELEKIKTELEEAYLNLQETKSQLFQVEKLASIGQLAAGVAHEINNPIGFIKNNITIFGQYYEKICFYINALRELSLEKKESKEETQKIIEELEEDLKIAYIQKDLPCLISQSQEGTERIQKIVADLKSFARKSSDDEIKLEDINDIVETAINIMWNEVKYKAEIKRDKSPLPMIKCNAQKICQVIVNLLMNSVQAIEEKGIISIKTYCENDFVVIEIGDNGAGMSKQVINRIFDPFFTTKEVGQGTGLGLSISFDVIKKYGGTLDVQSEIGKGSTFYIKLPMIS